VWRLVPWRGSAVRSWTDRGPDGLVVTAADAGARPVLVPDAFGAKAPGLQFDGSTSVLALAERTGRRREGRSSGSHGPVPAAAVCWDETYAPSAPCSAGPTPAGYPSSSIGLSEGTIVMVNREEGTGPYGEPLWSRVEEDPGSRRGRAACISWGWPTPRTAP